MFDLNTYIIETSRYSFICEVDTFLLMSVGNNRSLACSFVSNDTTDDCILQLHHIHKDIYEVQ